ncbi:MAG: hypothetical protein ACI9RP_003023 [Cyclobacteriaceae bacterium]|jgi:hypothetical protein
MKLTTPRLLIILVALVATFAIVRLTQNSNRSKSFRTELVNFKVAEADRIEITEAGQTMTLFKETGNWKVSTNQGTKEAIASNVESLLSTLNTIKPSRIATRSTGKWKDFSVDSTGTSVVVIGSGEELTNIVVGRFGVEDQRSFFTYVRLKDDDDVYVANNFMKMTISTSSDDFRNNIMMRIAIDSLSSISFNYPDSALVLTKQEAKWFKGSAEVDSAAIATYLNAVSFVTSKKFTDSPSTPNPEMAVIFSFSKGKEIAISAFKEQNKITLPTSANNGEAWDDIDTFNKVFAATSLF